MFAHRISAAIKRAAFRPRLRITNNVETVRLGTEYGGWDFIDTPNLKGSTIISCGLGEDASFDVAFAARYGARVILVDPTPRAVAHFEAIRANISKPASCEFVPGGNQPIGAYDLSKLTANSLLLVERAIWSEEKTLRFYAPSNPAHVSHSVTNSINGFASDTPYIEVQGIAIDTLLSQIGVASVPLLKLDIEGAEFAVIPDMLRKGIRPDQILIEFDENLVYSRRSKREIESVDRALRSSGYRLVHSRQSNFLYAVS